MKKYSFITILSLLNKTLLALAMVCLVSACDSQIYDYEEDCGPTEQPGNPNNPNNPKPDDPKPDDPGTPDNFRPVYLVEYVFDMNMQFVDAFSQRVNSVDLYVFTTSGSFVNRYHAEGMALKAKDYRMELTDLPAGRYELIAWCGLTDNSGHFSVPSDGEISQRYQVTATMATSTDAGVLYQNQNLHALFHGRLETATYTTDPVEQVYTIFLTKDTNNINLSLQHKDGLEFEKDRFTVAMIDNNQVMRFDNSVPAENPDVEYRPYRTAIGTVSIDKSSASTRASGSATVGNFLQVELATARLMTNHNPIITVTDNETGKIIFSIPLVTWALKLRSENYKNIEEQEYLDREDNFNLMLWLDNDDQGWFGAQLHINDWHVIDDENDLK